MTQRKVERLLKSSKITTAFQSKTFDNFDSDIPGDAQEMHRVARAYAEMFERIEPMEANWLLLLGESGTGKTHLACAAANVLITRGIPVLYFQHREGMNEIINSFRDKDDEGHSLNVSRLFDDMKNARVLVWDDLFKGREKPRPYDLDVVFDVLNSRYLNRKPTIISSERLPHELMAIDKAIGGRIVQSGQMFTAIVQDPKANYRVRDLL
jgi:DNA replication protein DnaC